MFMKLLKLGSTVFLGMLFVLSGCSKQSQNDFKNSSKTDMNSSAKTGSKDYSFKELNSQLEKDLGSRHLPKNNGLSDKKKIVNIRYVGNHHNNKIFYSVGSKPLPLNDSKINIQGSYAVLTKTTYKTSQLAKNAVNFVKVNKKLPKVKLAGSFKASTQAGGGQEYIYWNKSNWSYTVHGSKVNNTEPKKLAQSAYKFSDKMSLPTTSHYGAINLEVNGTGLAQGIAWQRGNIVYRLQAKDPKVALLMISSTK